MAVSAPPLRPREMPPRGKPLPPPNLRWAGYTALLGARMK